MKHIKNGCKNQRNFYQKLKEIRWLDKPYKFEKVNWS